MKPSSFRYVRATSIDEAVQALSEGGEDAKILAGGQSLIPLMNFRMSAPSVLVDISRIAEIKSISQEGGTIKIGAGVCHNDVLASESVRNACPLLIEAYGHVAHHAIRNRGTIGGNICHHDPASEVPLILTLLNAQLTLVSPSGTRTVEAADFFVDAMETVTAEDELLVEVSIPAQTQSEGWAFEEKSSRVKDFATVSAGCRLTIANGQFSDVRVGITGGGAHIKRMAAVEAMLEGASASTETIQAAATLASESAEPTDDVQADAAYKRDLIQVLCARTLSAASAKIAA